MLALLSLVSCIKLSNGCAKIHQGFTKEAESNDSLPFLDVFVERKNGEFVTSVYRKNTFTGQYVNYNSYCTEKRKVNLIRTLCDRAIKICSASQLDAEVENIFKIFIENGYPENLVKKTIKQRLDSSLTIKEPIVGPGLHRIVIKLPYLGQRSQRMGKDIDKTIGKCYNTARARAIFTSSINFSPATKDHIPTFNKSTVIYRFSCRCGNDYVGKTSRRLVDRIKEHVPVSVQRFLAHPFDNFMQDTTLNNASIGCEAPA